MNRILALIGILLSAIYVYVIWLLVGDRLLSLKTMGLNEVGDFLAGAFGPVAILWLVLGFFQQGYELRQNNAALKLQADELKNSVSQQKEMVGIAGRQLAAELDKASYERDQREKALLPIFKLAAYIPSAGQAMDVELQIGNIGNIAEDVQIHLDGKLIGEVPVIDRTTKAVFKKVLPRADAVYNVHIGYKYAGERFGAVEYKMSVCVTNAGNSIAKVKFQQVNTV